MNISLCQANFFFLQTIFAHIYIMVPFIFFTIAANFSSMHFVVCDYCICITFCLFACSKLYCSSKTILIWNQAKWQALVYAVMNCLVSLTVGNFLTNWEPVSFSRRTLPYVVSLFVCLSKPGKEVVRVITADLWQWLHVFWHLIAVSAYSKYIKKARHTYIFQFLVIQILNFGTL